jgi:hypothetical protein
MLECAGWRRPESKVVVKKGTVVKKATVKRTSESRVGAKVVASRPSITTNRARIYVASHTEHFAELEDGSTGKWCVFRHNDAIDEAWLAIRGAIEAGRLALAKVSTRLTSVLRNYWRRTLHRWFSDKRLRARRRRSEEVLVMQAGQDRFSKHECTRRQSMSGF